MGTSKPGLVSAGFKIEEGFALSSVLRFEFSFKLFNLNF
jgi:hypothetical protein